MKRYKNTVLILLIVISFSFTSVLIYNISLHKKENLQHINSLLEKEATTYFKNIVTIRQWNADHGSVYVKQTNGLKPNPYLENNTLYTKDNELLIKMNPAWMTRQIAEITNKSEGIYLKITSLKPLNPKNDPDKFEKEALNFLKKNKNIPYYSKLSENSEIYDFMGSIKIKPSCVQCHAKQGYKRGDIGGGIRISIATEDYFLGTKSTLITHQNLIYAIIAGSIIVSVILFLLIKNLFNKQISLEKNNTEIKSLQNENKTLLRRYSYAIQSTKDGIWDWDMTNGEVFFSENWKKLLGYKGDEIQNKFQEWKTRIHPEDLESVLNSIQDNQDQKTSYYKQIYRLKHKNGNWIWILDRGKTYFDTDNKPLRMVGFHSNITEIKDLELKIKESEENLIAAQKIAKIGHWKYNLRDESFEFSKNLCELLDIKDCSCLKEYNDLKIYISNLDKKRVTQKHNEAIFNKTKMQLTYKLNKHNSSDTIVVEENIDIIKNMYDDYENNITFIGTIQDVTDKVTLKEELSQLQHIIDLAPISIVITDIKGAITYINPFFTKTTGYEKEEAIGQNPRILKSGHTSDDKYKILWETISNKKTWVGEFKNRTKEGKEYWESAIIVPILSENGEIKHYMAFKREITHEVFLKKELKERENLMLYQSKNAAMGEMISMIAHQWRQPITTISMNANNLLADFELGLLNEEDIKGVALNIAEQTQYLSKTIDDFRNFFQHDKNIEDTKIKEVFEKTSAIILASLKNNNIIYNINCNENIEIRTYPRELLQVIVNILKNSKEALEEKTMNNKTIEVNVLESPLNIDIKISNNADKIDEKDIDKIFDAYFTTKGERIGTGLGLYMSKTIVEKHLRGTLEVENIENGVTFTITLPKDLEEN